MVTWEKERSRKNGYAQRLITPFIDRLAGKNQCLFFIIWDRAALLGDLIRTITLWFHKKRDRVVVFQHEGFL